MGSTKARSKNGGAKKGKKGVYTMAEVSEHNTMDDCWLVYHDQVLDVSGWAPYHPGLPKTIMRFAGQDATDEIRQMHPDFVIDKKLPRFVIGTVSDPPEATEVQKDFRALYQTFVDSGYFVYSDWTFYYKKFALYLPLLALSIWLVVSSDNDYCHLLSAFTLGVFFWQMAFIGHDAGHMAVTGDRVQDWNFGLVAGNMLTGLSVGWWKATHNVHHAVPNAIHSDPDIAHLPVLAVSERFFESLANTYHNRVMEFDWLARNVFIPHQHYLYYPIMAVARVNLYLQSFLFLFKEKNALRRTEELVTLALFWTWQTWLLSHLNSWSMVLSYLLINWMVSGLLHVQITLSHFSMPVFDDSNGDYGGDFYSRNIKSSLDVDCPEWLDWVHGGLQFQTEHHVFPRLQRKFLRKTKPAIRALCLKHGLPWNEMGFVDCNRDVIRTLRSAAHKSRTWSPMIAESFNAIG
jgi:fatty acid desaturase